MRKEGQMRGQLLMVCLIGVILYGSGCATVLSDDSQHIDFTSNPPGAHVKVGPYECTTPCYLLIPKNKNYMVEASYGSQVKRVPLTRAVAGSTFLNILFWPGFIVDAITGNIKKYEPTSYDFTFTQGEVSKGINK